MASGTCSPSKPMASARAAWAPISPSPVDSGVAAMTLSMAETPWSACPGPTASRRSEAGSRSVVVAEDHRTGGHAHPAADQHRSEEHTSELQSRGHLVCRLLFYK